VWPEESVEQFFRYAIPGYSVPAGWKYRDFDFDRDYQRLGLTAYYDNSNPDLRKLKQSGAKLIVYHGGTDTIDLPGAMTDYYDTVERTMGGRKATQDFFRLFLIPGMNHCGGGKGAFAVDWLSVLEAWVERGQAPDVVMSAHVSDDYLRHGPIDLPPSFPADLPPEQRAGIAAFFLEYPLGPDVPLSFTRPIYAYPLFAKYRGSGDPDDASNFRAAHP
jgi:feruloyl esterase